MNRAESGWERVGTVRMVGRPSGYISENVAGEPQNAGLLLIAVSSFGEKPKQPNRDRWLVLNGPFPRAGYCPTCGRYRLDVLWCVRCYL